MLPGATGRLHHHTHTTRERHTPRSRTQQQHDISVHTNLSWCDFHYDSDGMISSTSASRSGQDIYFITESPLVIARLLIRGELCWYILRSIVLYPGLYTTPNTIGFHSTLEMLPKSDVISTKIPKIRKFTAISFFYSN